MDKSPRLSSVVALARYLKNLEAGKHGSHLTGRSTLAAVTSITGKRYRRSAYSEARQDLLAYIDGVRDALAARSE